LFSANWNITNLRPAPPLRPNLLTTTSAGANTSAQQLQSSPASLASSKKPQPTYEEDALVLRVIEAYCAAYQNTSRNTIHSGESADLMFLMISWVFGASLRFLHVHNILLYTQQP
jgi:hypothetical protein